MQRHKSTSEIIYAIVIVSACTIMLLLWLANTEGVSLSALLSYISTKLYAFRNENIFIVNRIRNINIFIYAYLIIAVSSLILFFLKKPEKTKVKKRKDKITPRPLPHPAFTVALIVFLLTSTLQLIYQIKYFSQERHAYSGKTLSERNTLIFGLPYEFATFCRDRLPGPHRGKYISDLSADEALGLMLRYRVAYHIYPINITIPTDQPIDSYVVFQKRDPQTAIPKEFEIRYAFDQFNVLAIKKRPE